MAGRIFPGWALATTQIKITAIYPEATRGKPLDERIKILFSFFFSTIFVYDDLPDMMYMDPSEGLFDETINVPNSKHDEFEPLDDASRRPRQLQERIIEPEIEWRDYQNSQACYCDVFILFWDSKGSF